jgi:hypothetical protein
MADGRPIEIGGRAFDVLAALVEAGGGRRQQGRADAQRLAKPNC